MLSQSLRALCLPPGGSGSVWKYLEAQVRSPGVSGRIACGFRTELHFADADDCYRSTMGVIVIGLGTTRSAGENFGRSWEHLGAPTTSLGAPGCAGFKSGCAGVKSGCAGGKSGSTSNHSRAVWEKQHLLWERCWCTWKS